MKLVVNARFLTQQLTGVQRYALELSLQLKQMIEEVVFVAPDAIVHKEEAAALGVTIIGKRKGHLWEQRDLPRFLKSNSNPPLLNLANTAPLRYRNNYLTIHDLAFFHHPEWNSRLFATWYRYLVPRIIKRSKHLFTVSETVKEELQRMFSAPQNKISVTYNGIAEGMLSQKKPLVKKRQVLAVGTFNPRKNHDKLIGAFLSSPIAGSYELIIAGSHDDVFRHAALSDNSTAITIIERPDDAELIRLYKESEILACLSSYEGFGLPVLEGLYFGCKVLCSDIPVFRELYGECAYFCDPMEMKGIGAALERVSKAPQDAKEPSPVLFGKYSYEAAAQVICNAIFS